MSNWNLIGNLSIAQGENGKSTYELWLENGNEGTLEEFLLSLKGQGGLDGITPNIQIGTVTTLEPNQRAIVTRRGTEESPIFDFGIPRGENGKTPSITHLENEINNKLREVDTAEQSRVVAEQKRVEDHQSREEFLNSCESQMEQIGTVNTNQDARLEKVEYVNKRQDVVLNGLFNENADGRLSIESEGNSVKLENSKEGVVEVNSVVGDTMVNYGTNKSITAVGDGISTRGERTALAIPLQNNKTYTIMFEVSSDSNTTDAIISLYSKNGEGAGAIYTGDVNSIKGTVYKKVVTTNSPYPKECIGIYIRPTALIGSKLTILNTLILEGDYTNKPIPQEYFEGMQSTFEECKVTQEMVDSGEESVENLGKYKCVAKVRGKNLLDKSKVILGGISDDGTFNNSQNYWRYAGYININLDSHYVVTLNGMLEGKIFFYDKDYKFISSHLSTTKPQAPTNAKYMNFRYHNINSLNLANTKIQIEEGTQATPYEPYKEHVQSLYLDEPLHANNELCVHDGALGYWKNFRKKIYEGKSNEEYALKEVEGSEFVSFAIPTGDLKFNQQQIFCNKFCYNTKAYFVTGEGIWIGGSYNIWVGILKSKLSTPDVDGFKTLLKQWNVDGHPLTIIYELKEPVFVPILEDTPKWVLDSFNDCTLHIDSNIPATSVNVSYTGNIPSLPAMEKNLNNVNDEQDMQNEIDNTTMLAIADIFEMLTPAIATSNINTKEGGNKMVELYVVLIMRGLKTIDQVPSSIRPQVEEMLKQVQ